MFAEEELARVIDHGFDQVARPVHRRGAAPAEHLGLFEYIFQGGDDERILGGEVMKLRATGKSRFCGDLGSPESGVTAAANEIGRGLENPRACMFGALGLGAPSCSANRPESGLLRTRDIVGAATHSRPQPE